MMTFTKEYQIIASIAARVGIMDYRGALDIIEHVKSFDNESHDPIQWREDMSELENHIDRISESIKEILVITEYWKECYEHYGQNERVHDDQQDGVR